MSLKMWQNETTEVVWDIERHPTALQSTQAPRYRKHWFRNQRWKTHYFTTTEALKTTASMLHAPKYRLTQPSSSPSPHPPATQTLLKVY